MSDLTRYLLVWMIIGIILGVLVPDARIMEGATDMFYDSSTGDFSEDFQQAKPELTSNENLLSFIGYIVLAWDMISLIISALLMPIGLFNYLNAIGAPPLAVVLIAVPYVALLAGIIADYIAGR